MNICFGVNNFAELIDETIIAAMKKSNGFVKYKEDNE